MQALNRTDGGVPRASHMPNLDIAVPAARSAEEGTK
jgi:hypothetical protein